MHSAYEFMTAEKASPYNVHNRDEHNVVRGSVINALPHFLCVHTSYLHITTGDVRTSLIGTLIQHMHSGATRRSSLKHLINK